MQRNPTSQELWWACNMFSGNHLTEPFETLEQNRRKIVSRKSALRFWNQTAAAAAAAKSLQSCPTLCDPTDGSPPGSPVPGILQARTLEWVAIAFSNAWKWKVKVKSLSRVRLFATPRTAAHQAPPSIGFPGKSTGVGCHCLLREIKLPILNSIHPELERTGTILFYISNMLGFTLAKRCLLYWKT